MKTLGLLILLITHTSYATTFIGGDRVGNGGDVLFCVEMNGHHIYVLEEYEEFSYRPQIGDKDLAYQEKVMILLKRIQKNFPVRYQYYKRIYESFRTNLTYVDYDLPEIDDANHWTSENCFIKQAAFFKESGNYEYKYFIQKGIWDSLSNNKKAVLMFHEILYTEAVSLGHNNSESIRKANRLIFSNQSYEALDFDNLFIDPIRRMDVNLTTLKKQLRNAYSENIAIYLLGKDLSNDESRKILGPELQNLKKRFSSNITIGHLVDQHLSRLNSIY